MRRGVLIAAATLALSVTNAHADDWHYRATLYGWFPGLSTSVDTRFGTVESDSSASDALSSLDMAFMGSFNAQNGKLSIVGDLLYVDLGNTQDGPFGTGLASITVDTRTSAFSGYALYRVTSDPKVALDIGAGFRSFDVSVDNKVTVGSLPTKEHDLDGSWVDPVIAARLAIPLDEKWFINSFADWGGTSSDDRTWQAYAGVGYNFDAHWAAQAGYRYMAIEHNLGDANANLDLSGFAAGVSYSF